MGSHIILDFLRCMMGRRLNFVIKDRIVLGLIAGIIGNIAKNFTSVFLERSSYKSPSVSQKAAGIFLSKRKAQTSSGKQFGLLVDFCIACKLGIGLVYLLSFTGRDHHLLKGANLGQMAWLGLYGLLSALGATKVHPVTPRTSFNNFLAHTVFGLVAAKVIVALGDHNLFKPHYSTLGNPSEE